MDTEEALCEILSRVKRLQRFEAVLLCGPSGSGKSMLARNCAKANDFLIRSLSASDLSNEESGAIERSIEFSFRRSKRRKLRNEKVTAVAVLVDDLDIWSPTHARTPSDIRITAALSDCLAAAHEEEGYPTILLATATDPVLIHPSLIRQGRIAHVISLRALSLQQRQDHILAWLITFLSQPVDHTVLSSQALMMARATPGFLMADLFCLFSRLEEELSETNWVSAQPSFPGNHLKEQEFEKAMRVVVPSLLAMSTKAIKPTATSAQQTGSPLFGLDIAMQQIRECLTAVFLQEQAPQGSDVAETVHAIRSLGCFRGMVLHGPTGCGKSALANMSRFMLPTNTVNYLSVDSTSIVSSVIGEAERNVSQLFSVARAIAPAIIVIDNVDVLAPRRSNAGDDCNGDGGSSSDAFNRLLSTFLVEVDGLNKQNDADPIFVIATARSLDIIDPALLRPGRFELNVSVHPPDAAARFRILESFYSAKGFKSDRSVASKAFARALLERQQDGWTAPDIFSQARNILINDASFGKDPGKLTNGFP